MNTRDLNLSKEINKEATTRQLYRYYREAVNHLNDVTEHYNTGSEWHLGENIRRVLRNASQELDLIKIELKERNIDLKAINNVPELILKKSLKDLESAKVTKLIPVNNESSVFEKWHNKELTELSPFDTTLFELFLMASESKKEGFIIAFPEKFKKSF